MRRISSDLVKRLAELEKRGSMDLQARVRALSDEDLERICEKLETLDAEEGNELAAKILRALPPAPG